MSDLNKTKSKNYLFFGSMIAAVMILIINGLIMYQVMSVGNTSLLSENSTVENAQVAFYTVSFLVLIFNLFRKKGVERWLTSFFMAICLTFILREVDVEKLNVPEILVALGSGKGRNIILITSFVILFALFFLRYCFLFGCLKKLMKSPVVRVCLAGCFFLLLGAVGDENDWLLLEELCEMNGAFLICISALLLVKRPDLLMAYVDKPTSKNA